MTMSDTFPDLSPSHLQLAATAFNALTSEPRLLSLDCDELQAGCEVGLDLPPGRVLLRDLRTWMLAHRDKYPARNAIWRELIIRARRHGGEWLLAAVGMAVPRLVRDAGALAREYHGDPADIDAAIVEGFLDALTRKVDLAERGLYAKLCWAGFRAGHAVRYADADILFVDNLDNEAVAPHWPYGHVDLLLARAVALELIDRDEADLIIDTRLEYEPIEDLAERAGAEVSTLRRRRERAGLRVAAGLAQGHLSGPVSAEVKDILARQAARRRAGRGPHAATGAVAS
jgi:hypothetical protein